MREKKRKIFYLNFIRVLAMLIIVTYHFFVHALDNGIMNGGRILANGKWGLVGVTLFFMISGASLMYNYGEQLEIKQYYKKRFLGIYPMFWIAYSAVFLYIFYECKGIPINVPIKNIVVSFFAMDGYLSSYIDTFYLIGEWFLGCIVLIYVLFPLLRKTMKQAPKTLLILASLINFGILIFYQNGTMPINQNLLVCTFSFVLGMYIITYISTYKLWHAVLAMIVGIGLCFVPTTNINYTVLISNIIGYNAFIVLAYIGEKIVNIKVQQIFNCMSKYSYAIFLLHHYIIMKIQSTFQGISLHKIEVMCLYLACWIVIGIGAKILYEVNQRATSLIIGKRREEKV